MNEAYHCKNHIQKVVRRGIENFTLSAGWGGKSSGAHTNKTWKRMSVKILSQETIKFLRRLTNFWGIGGRLKPGHATIFIFCSMNHGTDKRPFSKYQKFHSSNGLPQWFSQSNKRPAFLRRCFQRFPVNSRPIFMPPMSRLNQSLFLISSRSFSATRGNHLLLARRNKPRPASWRRRWWGGAGRQWSGGW